MYGISRRKLGGVSSSSGTFVEPSSVYPIYSGGVSNGPIEPPPFVVHAASLPKLQVVKKEGNYFALNNAQLDLCRKLEREGKCSKVKLDIVPLNQVPQIIRAMMTVPDATVAKQEKTTMTTTTTMPTTSPLQTVGSQAGASSTSKPSRTSTKGYERLGQSDRPEMSACSTTSGLGESIGGGHVMSSELEESASESSEYADSDYEWSESDSHKSPCPSVATDEEHSDNEKESLL